MRNKIKRIALSVIVMAFTVSIFSAFVCNAQENNRLALINEFNSAESFSDIMKMAFEFFVNTDEDYAEQSDLNINYNGDIEGVEIKPINVTMINNVKNGMLQSDIKVNYDSKRLATVDLIRDNEQGINIARLSELSKNYLKINDTDIDKMIDETNDDDMDIDIDEDDIYAMDPIRFLAALSQCEKDELTSHLKEYVDFTKSSLPEIEKGDSEKINIDGADYNCDTYVSEVTVKQMCDIIEQISKKLKTDNYFIEAAKKAGYTEKQFKQLVDDYFTPDTSDMTKEELNHKITLQGYKYNGEKVGFNIYSDKEISLKFIDIDNKLLYSMNDFDGYEAALTYSDKTINGTVKITDEEGTAVVTLDNLVINDKGLTGEAEINMPFVDDTDSNKTSNLNLKYKSTSENGITNKNIDAYIDGENLFNISFDSKPIESTDIVVPTQDVYNYSDSKELSKYVSSCDVDGFLENAKNVLGPELYQMLADSFNSGISDDDSPESDADNETAEPKKTTAATTKKVKTSTAAKNDDSSKAKAANSTSSKNDNSANNSVRTGSTALSLGVISLAAAAGVVLLFKKKK